MKNGRQRPPQSSVNALASLVKGSASGAPPANIEADDSKLAADIDKMLDFATKLAGDEIFDVQILIEACAEELREQIRDEVSGGPT